MPFQRPPWWLYIVIASFVAFAMMNMYTDLRGPINVGIYVSFASGYMTVTEVVPGSSADKAGLQRGDRIVAASGQSMYGLLDWMAVRVNLDPSKPFDFETERNGERFSRTVNVEQRTWASRRPREQIVVVLNLVGQFIMLVLAISIAMLRPYDFAARLGALLLGTIAVFDPNLPYGFAVTWRSLPTPLGLFLWLPLLFQTMLPPVLFTFCATFPRRLFDAKWAWIAALLPGGLISPALARHQYIVLYDPQRVTGLLPVWQIFAIPLVSGLYMLAAVAALILNYRLVQELNDRRRVRVLVAGLVVAMIATLPWLGIFIPGTPGAIVSFNTSTLYTVISNALFYIVFPLSFAYSVVRHRLFDVRIMVRQGLQYAVARGALVAVAPLVAVVFFVDILLHADQPLASILKARGWMYFALGAVAVVAHLKQQRWLVALDRRFFRERYDAQQLLRQVVDDVLQARTFERVAPHVVTKIVAAFHSEFVALLTRSASEERYRTAAAAPTSYTTPVLSGTSKFIGLMRLLAKPIEVSQTEGGWLRDKLPAEEITSLQADRIELLVPVAIGGDDEALMLLGPKKSEEPYTREDQELLVTISKSLALLLEKKPSAEQTTTPHVPRVLAGRYRIDRLIGRGGMGSVYAATDTALDRQVALKLLRDELLEERDLVDRFAQEAKVAAGFAHPNVVTIYDFGVADNSRAFLVMELLQGQTLRETLQQYKRLEPTRVVEIMRGVCSAIDAAHARQLIHRDLKPENILLAQTSTGEVPKVLDFGIAKLLATNLSVARTATGFAMGTPLYMSPEQLRGEDATAAWDLWALSVVLYEMLVGHHPFAVEGASNWQQRVLRGEFQPVSSKSLQEFFARAFAPDIQRRPSTANELFNESSLSSR